MEPSHSVYETIKSNQHESCTIIKEPAKTVFILQSTVFSIINIAFLSISFWFLAISVMMLLDGEIVLSLLLVFLAFLMFKFAWNSDSSAQRITVSRQGILKETTHLGFRHFSEQTPSNEIHGLAEVKESTRRNLLCVVTAESKRPVAVNATPEFREHFGKALTDFAIATQSIVEHQEDAQVSSSQEAEKEGIIHGWWFLLYVLVAIVVMFAAYRFIPPGLTRVVSVPPLSYIEEQRCEAHAEKLGKQVVSVGQYQYEKVDLQRGFEINVYATCVMADGSSISTLQTDHTLLSKNANAIYFLVANFFPIILFTVLLILPGAKVKK